MLRLDDSQIKWENKFRAFAFSVLKNSAPPITSEGDKFYNSDWWTLNYFVQKFCDHAKSSKTFDFAALTTLVDAVHKQPKPRRKIVVAMIPDNTDVDFISGVVGGVYHECAHTLYTHRSPLDVDLLWDIVGPRWDKVSDWSVLTNTILYWYNIVEDIKIERNLLKDYPHLLSQMEDLQDFILRLERKNPAITAVQVLNGTFRDLGLGYKTPHQEMALELYEKSHPLSFNFVNTVLKDILDQAINIPASDTYAAFRLALDVVIAIVNEFGIENIKQNPPPSKKSLQGDGDGEKEDSQKGSGPGVGELTEEQQELLDSLLSGGILCQSSGLQNIHDAINDKVEYLKAKEPKAKGARKFAPFSTKGDKYSKPSTLDAKSKDNAKQMLATLYTESSYMRAKIAQLIKAQEQTYVLHGLKKGREMSEPFLVDTIMDLKEGKEPRRAFWDIEDQLDTSMAAYVVLDQSGSMASWVREAGIICMSILEPLDRLNVPTACVGLYDFGTDNHNEQYHRTNNIQFFIYKEFQDKFNNVLPRFATIHASGTTPLADGVELGIRSLQSRKEKHKFLFVVTDGQPNYVHGEVMLTQLPLAKKLGIHVIGVGLGSYASYVSTFFPDHVHSNNIKDIPKMLGVKICDLVQKRILRR